MGFLAHSRVKSGVFFFFFHKPQDAHGPDLGCDSVGIGGDELFFIEYSRSRQR